MISDENPVILFDGVCNYCNAMVNFIIRQDKKKKFRFAALQSIAGQRILKEWNQRAENPDSFILINNSRLYKSSTAALKLYNLLPWYWKWTQVFWIFPRFLRDAVYGVIARNRYKWFGKRESCRVPEAGVLSRFINDL
jgi:predicted DCC family thiol-disulfide oxidoreductase YuxK